MMDNQMTSVRARKKAKKGKLAHILIRPDDVGGHVVEEHHEPSEHFAPSEVKVRAFSASPEESKEMVKHVVHTLGLPLDTDDDDDESSEDEE